tara:strand:+ start:369 stop:470 length:102 start_codon:yes stop_codon:yes gene_type:complete
VAQNIERHPELDPHGMSGSIILKDELDSEINSE